MEKRNEVEMQELGEATGPREDATNPATKIDGNAIDPLNGDDNAMLVDENRSQAQLRRYSSTDVSSPVVVELPKDEQCRKYQSVGLGVMVTASLVALAVVGLKVLRHGLDG